MSTEDAAVAAFAAKVYDLFLSTPITSAFRDEPGPEDEAPEVDEEMQVAVRADRFMLMSAVRRLMHEPQRELPL